MRSAFSITSARLSVESRLKGRSAVPLDVGAQTRLFGRLGRQIYTPANDLRDASLQCGQTEQVHAGVRIKPGGENHIAVGVLNAASDGAEQRQATDGGVPQFCLVHARR